MGIILATLLLAGAVGCSLPQIQKPGTSGLATPRPGQAKATALYSDFGDVLIPSALKPDNDASYIVQTPGFATGMLALKGRVKRNSLIEFFNHNMARDNWRVITMFKSPQTSTILLYQKESRWCVINIREHEFNTYVQIGVAPTMNPGMMGTGGGMGQGMGPGMGQGMGPEMGPGISTGEPLLK